MWLLLFLGPTRAPWLIFFNVVHNSLNNQPPPRSQAGMTALQEAVLGSRPDIVEVLLDDPRIQAGDKTVLFGHLQGTTPAVCTHDL